jgi:hypothetical protein
MLRQIYIARLFHQNFFDSLSFFIMDTVIQYLRREFPAAPPHAVWDSVDNRSQEILRQIARIFESIDHLIYETFVNSELRELSPDWLIDECARLDIRERRDHEVLGYLSDKDFVLHWKHAIGYLAGTFNSALGASKFSLLLTSLYMLFNYSKDLAIILQEAANVRRDISEVFVNIFGRCTIIDAFLDVTDHIHLRQARGSSIHNIHALKFTKLFWQLIIQHCILVVCH